MNNNGNINEIADFKRLSDLKTPTGTELTLKLTTADRFNVIITEHLDEYDDPQEQKYKVKANGQTSYLFMEDLQVKIAKEDADGLPLGTKRTVAKITIH